MCGVMAIIYITFVNLISEDMFEGSIMFPNDPVPIELQITS